MKRPFKYLRAESVPDASAELMEPGARVHAGGTDLLGCLHDDVFEASKVVSISGLDALREIRETSGGGLSIGALVTIDTLSRDRRVRERYPGLAQAASEVASPQLRNQGTLGGNLCQWPRCWYLRGGYPCLKRGGRECFAVDGENEYHAILGGGPCYIVFPSDCAPMLGALDAIVVVRGRAGERRIPLEQFYVLPEERLDGETVLDVGDVVTEVTLPGFAVRSSYRKVRARQVWDFALASVAIAMLTTGTRVQRARVWLGGVAPVPWRAVGAERVLVAEGLSRESVRKAAEAAVEGAAPLEKNGYKVGLVRGVVEEELGKYL